MTLRGQFSPPCKWGPKLTETSKGKRKSWWHNGSAVEEDKLTVMHYNILVCGVLIHMASIIMWLQLFCKKQASKWGQMCYISLCMMEKVWIVCVFECHALSWEPYRIMAWLFCILCTVQNWLHSFFGNLSWHWKEGAVTSAQFKNGLLLCAAQTVEKMVDIFIRDTALKECPLCRSQYGY